MNTCMNGWMSKWMGTRGKPSTGARGNAARVGRALGGSADLLPGGERRTKRREGHRRRTAQHSQPSTSHTTTRPPPLPSAPRFPSRLARSHTTAFPRFPGSHPNRSTSSPCTDASRPADAVRHLPRFVATPTCGIPLFSHSLLSS